ncbi:pyridoxamine 5'-phosphate oxidase family protein [Parvularcula dongshanensis]|uniref:General stress protein 26 n=1 Tax=Parvularcula dongshanensis TaxID=1173995 RepID=A0A840I6N0_9PROT|nr:pyridoxamine 5'-phosphate oxidase family protein [Parvularcula dongshanensis]MBB4659911.1 general stress protein 26 [Parvularcula dongshanensis]
MVDLKETREAPEKQFWEEVKKVRAGMLGVKGLPDHMQPMSPREEPEAKKLWFYLHNDSDLCKQVQAGHAEAHFCVVGKDHDYHACAKGTLRENKDPAKVDQFWDPIVAAWFEHGKEDPRMTLIEMTLEHAAIWGSTDSSTRFGWEIAKSNLMDDKVPDVGVRTDVTF